MTDFTTTVHSDPTELARPASTEMSTATDAELVQQLRDLTAGIDIATATMLSLLSEIDRREAWAGFGIKSCAHWLSWRCGIGVVAARSHVRVARALRELPKIRAEFDSGRLSYAKVRAITRIADLDNEDDLVHLAHSATAAQTERAVRAWRRVDVLAGPEVERLSEVRWHWDDDGMLVLRARLSPDEGGILLAAIGAVRVPEVAAETHIDEETAPGIGAAEAAQTIPRNRLAEESATRVDALVGLARAFLDPQGRVDQNPEPHLVVRVDSRVLSEDVRAGRATFELGGALSAAMARRLACDCAVIALLTDGDDVLNVGRPSRRISVRMARALRARDGGCVFPGCCERRPARLQAHHVWHWADGGPTELPNLVLLCRYHHRSVHEDGYLITFAPGATGFIFASPGGVALDQVPPTSLNPGALPGQKIDVEAIPQWAGEPLDLDFAIGVLRDSRNHRRSARERLVADQRDAAARPAEPLFVDWAA